MLNSNTPDPRTNPFVVPGSKRSVESTSNTQTRVHPPTRDTETRRQGSNPFRWVVPNKPTKAEQEAVTGVESPQPQLDSEPTLPGHDPGDQQSHEPTRRTDHNDNALDRTGQPGDSMLVPNLVHPKTEGHSIPSYSKASGLTSGYVRLLDDRDDEDNDDRTSRTETHGGDGDSLLARHNVTVSDDGVYAMDSTRLREGVQIGTVKRELIADRPRSKRRTPRKQSRAPFSPQIPKILDFLTRWRIGTTLQLARVAGWRDPNKNRVLKKLRSYDEVGFMRETDIYAGPKIWTATEHGAELGFHSWLGGVKASEINPMSQSHSFGLSSIASWLLCPWDMVPNILGLPDDEWRQVRGEITNGTAYVIAEREYRSSYSSIRTTRTGLLPPEYRHGFIGGPGGQTPVPGAWREWALAYKNGASTLADSPELLACDPEFMGANMWMWIIWGNSVWNPKVLETRAGQEVDLDDLSWAGHDGGARLRSEFRQYGFVDIEERLDYASNKPLLNKALGDRFALWDHLPDLIIARRRTDDAYADPQSIAIELELSAKTPEAYARTMASYGSPLGQTLYSRVIWLVPSKTIAVQIREGASQVGMILGEDYDIVPFVTSNEASVIKRSFYSGTDILPGRWNQRGIIEPCEFRSIPLA